MSVPSISRVTAVFQAFRNQLFTYPKVKPRDWTTALQLLAAELVKVFQPLTKNPGPPTLDAAQNQLGDFYFDTSNKKSYVYVGSPVFWREIQLGGTPASVQLYLTYDDDSDSSFNGKYREIGGGTFPTSVIWYDSNLITKKKVKEKLITRNGNQQPTTIVWKFYDVGEVLTLTITDTITYSGAFEASRSRTVV